MSDFQGEKEQIGRAIYNQLKRIENKEIKDEYSFVVDTGNYICKVFVFDKYYYLTGKRG